jgi:hypothetical protein
VKDALPDGARLQLRVSWFCGRWERHVAGPFVIEL